MEPSAAVTVAPAKKPAEAAAQKKRASQNCEASIFAAPENCDLSGTSSETSQEPALGKDRSEEEWDDDAEDDETTGGLIQCKRQRQLSPPNRQASPFDVRFSQMRARTEFRDGRSVEDAVSSIKAVRCPDQDGERPIWRLEAPFPPIEVLQYRCKLRGEDGRPKLDPVSGGEMWDGDDHLFTLDNRRLYCYQKAAAALWPDKVIIDVIELPPQSLTRMRQVRKFRTMDSGESILLGARASEDALVRWSWREKVGLGTTQKCCPEPDSCYVKMRRRPRGEPRNGRSNGKTHPSADAAEKENASGSFAKRFVTFLALYLLLRLGKNFISARFDANNGIGLESGEVLPIETEPAVVPEHFTTPILEASSFKTSGLEALGVKTIGLETPISGHASENMSVTGVGTREANLWNSLDAAAALESPIVETDQHSDHVAKLCDAKVIHSYSDLGVIPAVR
jgi:hypothetical protein